MSNDGIERDSQGRDLDCSQSVVEFDGFTLLDYLPTRLYNSINTLQRLKMNHCELSELCDDIGKFDKLHTLVLEHNALESLPLSFATLCRLKHLFLRHNLISHLPPTLSKCTELEDLYLADNRLTCKSFEIDGFKSLTKLKSLGRWGRSVNFIA
jgi:Leucine-rich repeat (LRR) protein